MITKTFADVLSDLKREDEVTLLEILNLSTDELVDLLQDTIEDNMDRILAYYNETEDDSDVYWQEEKYGTPI